MNAVLLCALPLWLALAWLLARDGPDHLRYFQARLDPGPPTRPWRRLPWPTLGPRGLRLLGLGTSALCLAAAAGPAPRAASLAASGALLVYLSHVRSHPVLRRKAAYLPLALLLLAATPGLDRPLGEAWSPLWLVPVQLLLVQAYFSAGLMKVRASGWGWASGRVLRVHLAEHALWGGFGGARWMAARPRLCALAATALLAWELTFPLALLGPGPAAAWLAAGVLFHEATRRVMGIRYFRYFGLLYLSFAPALLA